MLTFAVICLELLEFRVDESLQSSNDLLRMVPFDLDSLARWHRRNMAPEKRIHGISTRKLLSASAVHIERNEDLTFQ